jgi:predicted HTH transcriptional regulator
MTDLNHKGMRPGIVRILAEYPEIQLENDASAKEFKVIIKRIIQKREAATQKRETATQKREAATQKRETATQKGQFEDIDTTQKKEIATQKNLDTTQKKVLEYFKDNPKATRVDAANALGNITEDGVKFIIAKLQKKGLLKRVGGRKYGEWLVFI